MSITLQSYGEVSVEVGEQRGGFICSFKFDSLKLAQVWFGVLQSRAASVAKYSTIVFIGESLITFFHLECVMCVSKCAACTPWHLL